MNIQENYYKIIKYLCNYYNYTEEELLLLLKENNMKYLLLLILKKYRCFDKKTLQNILGKDSRNLNGNIKKAEEKFLINVDFRNQYFELEEKIQKII